VQDSSLSTAYFSSGRNGGMGDMDIYKVIYLDKIKKDCPSEPSPVISLQVLDEDTSDFKNAIEVKAPANYSVLSYSWRFNNEERPANARFENDYRAAGTYSVESKVVALCDTCLNPVIACNTVLNDFKPRATVPTPSLPITFDINNFKGELDDEQLNKLGFNPSPIYFDFDRSSLRDDAITVLENNIVALLKYPNLNVRIVGYTDSRGPDTYNKILSERRAKAAHSYLLKKGIPSSRVELVEGKGASDLLNNCGKGKRCSESEHQKNRRVIFIISINKS
jgi:outer membrane protein OmpA-like peptidoglycan-associated protein